MFLLNGDSSHLASWIRKEIELREDVSQGRRGAAVKRIQEWLNLRGFGVAIDSDFGAVTDAAVQRFQDHVGLKPTGIVNPETFDALVQPMKSVLLLRTRRRVGSLPEAVILIARAHLAQRPVEVGGQNRGPWVRLYMKGNEGTDFPWCAGFVTFVIRQAAESLNGSSPITGSLSCDTLAGQAKNAGVFMPGRSVQPGTVPSGSIFLVRRTPTDWTHTGLVTDSASQAFGTIEGNTNDDGHREGFEVCARSRGYKQKDFIRLSSS